MSPYGTKTNKNTNGFIKTLMTSSNKDKGKDSWQGSNWKSGACKNLKKRARQDSKNIIRSEKNFML